MCLTQRQRLCNMVIFQKFVTLALRFPLCFFCFYVYICVLIALICLISLGLLYVCILSMFGYQILHFLCICYAVSKLGFLGVYVCACCLHGYKYLQYAYAYKWAVYACLMYAHPYSFLETLIHLLFIFPLLYSHVWPLFNLIFVSV